MDVLLNVLYDTQCNPYNDAMFIKAPWMEDLGIRNNEVKVFSFIYNHTVSKDTVVDVNQGYLAEIMGVTRKTVLNVLNRLVEKGWLCKVDRDYTVFTGYVLNYSKILQDFPSLVNSMLGHLLPRTEKRIKFTTGKRVYHNPVKFTPSSEEKFTPLHNIYNIDSNIYSCNSSKIKENVSNNKYITVMPRCNFSPECVNVLPEIEKLSTEDLSTVLDYVQNLLLDRTEKDTQKEELVTENPQIVTENLDEITINDEFITETPDFVTENTEIITEIPKDLPNSKIEQENFSKNYVEYCQSLLVEYLDDRRTGVEILAQNTLFGNNLPRNIKRTKATVADIYKLIEDLYPHTQGGIVEEINELLRMLVISCLERNHKPSYKSWALNLGHLMEYCEGDLSVAKLEISQQLAGEQDLPLAKYKVGSTYLKFNLGKHLDVPDVYYAVVDERCDPTKGPKYEETNTWLKKYLRMRVGKDHINFDLDGWHDLIDHLFVYSEGNIDVAAETIRIQTLRSATTTVPYGATGLSKTEFEERDKLRYTSRYPQRGFTDTLAGVKHPKACADMTPEEYEKFVAEELAHNPDGSLMKF